MNKCSVCNYPIVDGETFVEKGPNTIHSDCFRCADCDDPIKGKFFHREIRNTNLTEWVCVNCIDGCHSCNEPIKGGFVRVEGNRYHKDCVKCEDCHIVLTSYVLRDKEIVCKTCFQGCLRCKQPIRAGQTQVKFGEHRIHKTCFTCDRCSKPIDGKFQRKDLMSYCEVCAK